MENITFTAQWAPVTYSITYNLASGSVEGTNPTSYNIESASITLINPTRNGYDFEGWTGTGITFTFYTTMKNKAIHIGVLLLKFDIQTICISPEKQRKPPRIEMVFFVSISVDTFGQTVGKA